MNLKMLFRSLVGLPAFEIPQNIHLCGHNGPISLHHDLRTGIPQVQATTLHDAVFGQGYISGLHRAFQMELNRRTAAARLSEISGPTTLDIDRWVCRLGIPEAVEASMRQVQENKELLQLLQSYSAGVNLAWEEYPCPSFEYALLGFSPKPWTPEDCIRIVALLSWSLAGNWQEQLVRLQCIEALGPEAAALLESSPWKAPSPEDYLRRLGSAYASFLDQYQHIARRASFLPRRSGSNAFIVDGAYTDSGKPIFATDPHLPLSLPGWFYQCKLSSTVGAAPLEVAGAAIAGIPGIIAGRNRDLAWGITITGAATATLCLEQASASQTTRAYTIPVKNRPAVQECVSWTARGPLLAQPSQGQGSGLFSLCWTGHAGDAAGTLDALWKIALARTGSELQKALERWSAPIVNFCWAEVEKDGGDYGWQIVGQIPLRKNPTDGFLPVLGREDDALWHEPIPSKELPGEVRPERGYVVSANQQMSEPGYPYVISHEYIAPYRAKRIEYLLLQTLATKKYSYEDARRIQVDQVSIAALEMRDLILQCVTSAQTSIEREALLLLQEWDGDLAASSSAAALEKVTEAYIVQAVARRLFGETDLADHFRGRGQTPLAASTMSHWRMQEILSNIIRSQSPLKDLQPADWQDLIQDAFFKALAELQRLQGPKPSGWSWGKLHQLEIAHPLILKPVYQSQPWFLALLQRAFRLSRGPYPIGGDEHTVWQSSYAPVPRSAQLHPRRFWPNAYQPAVRLVAMHNGFLASSLPGGVSGQTTHPWSDNQLAAYLEGRLEEISLV